MLPSILEAVVANPPHIVNVICDFIAFRGFTVTFNDDLAFTRFRNLRRRHVYARHETLIAEETEIFTNPGA
jgi:hypothetical protein